MLNLPPCGNEYSVLSAAGQTAWGSILGKGSALLMSGIEVAVGATKSDDTTDVTSNALDWVSVSIVDTGASSLGVVEGSAGPKRVGRGCCVADKASDEDSVASNDAAELPVIVATIDSTSIVADALALTACCSRGILMYEL